jgi:hypothetical protein
VETCVLLEKNAHHQIVVEELARIVAIGAYSSDHRRQVDDGVGMEFLVKALYGVLSREVEIPMAWDNDITATF